MKSHDSPFTKPCNDGPTVKPPSRLEAIRAANDAYLDHLAREREAEVIRVHKDHASQVAKLEAKLEKDVSASQAWLEEQRTLASEFLHKAQNIDPMAPRVAQVDDGGQTKSPSTASNIFGTARPNHASQTPQRSSTQVLTPAQKSVLEAKLHYLKGTASALPFLKPIDPAFRKTPTHAENVKQPMDLSTMEQNLEDGKHSSIDDFVKDFDLIVDNAKASNAAGQAITKAAITLDANFRRMMRSVPRDKSLVSTPVLAKRASSQAVGEETPRMRATRRKTPRTGRSASHKDFWA